MIKVQANFDTEEEKLQFQDVITKHFKIDIRKNRFNHQGKSFLRVHLSTYNKNACSLFDEDVVK